MTTNQQDAGDTRHVLDYELADIVTASTNAQMKAVADDTRMDILNLLLEKAATVSQLAEALDTTIADIALARRSAQRPAPLSLEGAVGVGAVAAEEALLDGRGDPARVLMAEEARSLLQDQLRQLPEMRQLML